VKIQSLTVTASTYLKTSTAPASTLRRDQRRSIVPGSLVDIDQLFADRSQHYHVVLNTPMLADDEETLLTEGFIYGPHTDIVPSPSRGEPDIVKLDVPYYSQLDNATRWHGAPSRQCCLTSNTMLADYLLDGELSQLAEAEGMRQPESYYGQVLAQRHRADTTDHDGNTMCLLGFGISSYWSKTLSVQDIRQSLDASIPVVAGVAFRSFGHIVVIVGYDDYNGEWLVHDPYGIRYGSSDRYEIGADGSFDRYSQQTMDQIFWDGGPEAGWGRIVTHVRGQRTGLPPHL